MKFEHDPQFHEVIGGATGLTPSEAAFLVLLTTFMSEADENPTLLTGDNLRRKALQLMAAAQPDTTVTFTDISEGVNKRLPPDLLEAIGGGVFGAVIRWDNSKLTEHLMDGAQGHGFMECVALAKRSKEDPPPGSEEVVTKAIAEACAEVGYYLPKHITDGGGNV